MRSFTHDLRYACRSLVARPGFSLLATVTLAIGIGVTSVAFSALNGLLRKPQRFPDAERLGWILTKEPGNAYGSTSLPDFEDVRRASRAFESIAAEGRMVLSMRTEGGAEEVWALLVSSDYLPMLRARACPSPRRAA